MRAVVIVVVAVAMIAPATAGGLVLPIRGVRDLERGGALIAGADDADALWLDPAGLAHFAGNGVKGVLFDVALVAQPVSYTRIDSAGAVQPAVTNQQPTGQPIPTIAGALGIGDKLVIAGGITAPYAGGERYDLTGTQRYASVELASSSFVVVTVGAAYAISRRLRIGATLQDVVSTLDAQVVASECPKVCAAEDASYDAPIRIQHTDYIAPSGSIGVQYDFDPRFTLGAMVQAPSKASGAGTLTTRIPTAAAFDGAMVSGDQATMTLWLPPMVRAGVEWHPTPQLRVEVAVDVELWSFRDQITIVPDDVRIVNAPAGMYTLGPMTIPRGYATSFAPAIGAEYHIASAQFGAGISYETAATPADYVSALAVDSSKLLIGIGGGYAADGWQIGAAAGYVHLADVDVPLADAKVPQLQALATSPVFVNAGTYRSYYLLAGIRAARRF